jgi:hypothetical protein
MLGGTFKEIIVSLYFRYYVGKVVQYTEHVN